MSLNIELIKPKKITQSILQIIIDRIVNICDPEKIILFGSHAANKATDESDLDILIVIKSSDKPRHERVVPINLALSNIVFPMDILVYTIEEIDEWSDVPQAFITTIINSGKTIYEKINS